MTLTILVAPSGFKESLSAEEAADCIEKGVLRACPQAKVLKVPMVDGGEGFTKALVAVTGGTLHECVVTGPLGTPVLSHFGFLGGQDEPVAIIEMAAAAGLRLVPRDRRNPCVTTSYGVGELIRAALNAGARRILLGCGDSGVNDGGAGMAQALGVALLDKDGLPLPPGGGALGQLARIDLSSRDPRLNNVRIDAAVNWHNMLLGERGVARASARRRARRPSRSNCWPMRWRPMPRRSTARPASTSAARLAPVLPVASAPQSLACSVANCTRATTSSCNISISTA